MHDIWNPWHGCRKISEGCQNCYMMYLDQKHGNKNPNIVYKTKNFDLPLKKDKNGSYKIKAGETIRVCMNSDFLIEEADAWRDEIWKIIRIRSDVIFYILTKRPERMIELLPKDIEDGYENVIFNVTCENQKRLDERIPILKKLPFKHKGIMIAPILGEVTIEKYLKEGFIEQVICGGENYGGSRDCNFDWIKTISNECKKYDVTFAFIETGTSFIKDNKKYIIKSKIVQSKMAYKANVAHIGKKIKFNLKHCNGFPLLDDEMYIPKYTSINCQECGSRLICNGCSNCGKCKQL